MGQRELILILVACALSSPILASSGDVTIPATHLTLLRSRGPPLNIFVRRWIVWRHVSMLGVSVSAARYLHTRRLLRTFFSVLPILALRIFPFKKARYFDKTYGIFCKAFVGKWIYNDNGNGIF